MADTSILEEKKTQLFKLEEQLKPHLDKSKHTWPLPLMKRIHEAAETIKSIVAKDYYDLMIWPSKELSHPKAFFTGTHNRVAGFQRKETWLDELKWSKYTTTYTYANAWDKLPLSVAFYVPDTLCAGDKAPIMWFFHGGGYCTGANDHIPWLSASSMMNARDHQAIIIAPDYPLGPEANYQDIVDSLKDFLNFYKDDVCFEPGYENKGWTSWLVDQISSKRNVKGITIQTGRIFVEGESAGGNAAATALFLNAEKDHGTKIPIKVALLRYPMLAHYRRDFQSGMEYMGHKPPFQKRDELVKQLDLILGERDKLESAGYLPTRGRSAAPENMSAAFLLSVLHKWEESFKRKKPGQMVPDSFVNKDCIERANDSVDRVDATLLPAMYIYHGANDTNCPLADTNKFVKVLREKYPKQYTEDTLKLSIVPDKTHGFDYELVSEDVEWLKKAYDYVEKHWIEQPIK